MTGTKKQLTLASDDYSSNYFKHQQNKVQTLSHMAKNALSKLSPFCHILAKQDDSLNTSRLSKNTL